MGRLSDCLIYLFFLMICSVSFQSYLLSTFCFAP